MARILFAEDEPDIRELTSFNLRFAGHEVFTAANGEEFLAMAAQVKVDLFLLDVRMPRLTGYEACKILKRDADLRDIPVVFLSAKGQDNEVAYGLEVGAVEYVRKPVAPDELVDRINATLRKSRFGIYKE
jgi:DNA-binding response OmpR family regulator